jgi:hypothetical protein
MKVASRILCLAVVISMMSAIPVWAQQPAKGKPVTVTGRIVDNVCWLTMGQKGEGHKECAAGCDKAGVRMGLLDEKANVLYTLMADKPFVDPNAQVRDKFEQVVTVKGDLYEAPGGQKVLAVKEVQVAKADGGSGAAKNPCAGKK